MLLVCQDLFWQGLSCCEGIRDIKRQTDNVRYKSSNRVKWLCFNMINLWCCDASIHSLVSQFRDLVYWLNWALPQVRDSSQTVQPKPCHVGCVHTHKSACKHPVGEPVWWFGEEWAYGGWAGLRVGQWVSAGGAVAPKAGHTTAMCVAQWAPPRPWLCVCGGGGLRLAAGRHRPSLTEQGEKAPVSIFSYFSILFCNTFSQAICLFSHSLSPYPVNTMWFEIYPQVYNEFIRSKWDTVETQVERMGKFSRLCIVTILTFNVIIINIIYILNDFT